MDETATKAFEAWKRAAIDYVDARGPRIDAMRKEKYTPEMERKVERAAEVYVASQERLLEANTEAHRRFPDQFRDPEGKLRVYSAVRALDESERSRYADFPKRIVEYYGPPSLPHLEPKRPAPTFAMMAPTKAPAKAVEEEEEEREEKDEDAAYNAAAMASRRAFEAMEAAKAVAALAALPAAEAPEVAEAAPAEEELLHEHMRQAMEEDAAQKKAASAEEERNRIAEESEREELAEIEFTRGLKTKTEHELNQDLKKVASKIRARNGQLVKYRESMALRTQPGSGISDTDVAKRQATIDATMKEIARLNLREMSLKKAIADIRVQPAPVPAPAASAALPPAPATPSGASTSASSRKVTSKGTGAPRKSAPSPAAAATSASAPAKSPAKSPAASKPKGKKKTTNEEPVDPVELLFQTPAEKAAAAIVAENEKKKKKKEKEKRHAAGV